MKKVLIINGAKAFGSSGGKLNETLSDHAKKTLESLGLEVDTTIVDKGYNHSQEVEKVFSADATIWQMPGWWMGEPWIVKKYIDEVFSAGHGKLYASDGRSSQNPTKNYGKGGLMQGKKYMLSLTWNAPIEAFTDPNEFFEGVGVDVVYLHLHKAFQFLGLSVLPTFICNDVVKNPQVEQYLNSLTTHLHQAFGK
ncbi:NADPH quinone reductase MdaB [Helicobacter pylori]|nr:NADPH quinone reductase MdaB [Helicobacter pylori]